MKRGIIIILAFLVFACKEGVNPDQINQQTLEVKNDIKRFEVVISFKTNKADEFKLMLNNIAIDEFQRKNVHIIEKIEQNTLFESLKANFGENNISKNFSVNFGTKEIKTVEIGSISLSYGSNSFKFEGMDIKDYFTLNKYLTQDSISGKLQTQKVDDKHYPAMSLKTRTFNMLIKE